MFQVSLLKFASKTIDSKGSGWCFIVIVTIPDWEFFIYGNNTWSLIFRSLRVEYSYVNIRPCQGNRLWLFTVQLFLFLFCFVFVFLFFYFEQICSFIPNSDSVNKWKLYYVTSLSLAIYSNVNSLFCMHERCSCKHWKVFWFCFCP